MNDFETTSKLSPIEPERLFAGAIKMKIWNSSGDHGSEGFPISPSVRMKTQKYTVLILQMSFISLANDESKLTTGSARCDW